jgi:hypothetical protein
MDILFCLINLFVAPFWVLMIFVPAARLTGRLMGSPAVILGPAILYVLLIAPDLSHAVPILLSLDFLAIRGLIGTETGTIVSWAHFLAFDLFVGRWIYLDSRTRGISAWVTSPILLLTLLLGPLGFISYFAVRQFLFRKNTRFGAVTNT